MIGKGILRFQAIYWPAFLASTGEPGPTRIHVHPYLSLDGAKISKSSGATLDPVALVDRYGVDTVRWCFARDVHPVTDTDFSLDRLIDCANEDLAGGFGNLVNRITTLVHRYRHGQVPDIDEGPLPEVRQLVATASSCLVDLDLRGGSRALIDAVDAVNRDLEATAPWSVVKDPSCGNELDRLLVRHLRSVSLIVNALDPILPALAAKLRNQVTAKGGHLPPPQAVFPRLEPHPERCDRTPAPPQHFRGGHPTP